MSGTETPRLLTLLTFLLVNHIAPALLHLESIEGDLRDVDDGLFLLQTTSRRSKALLTNGNQQTPEAGKARATLPQHLYQLGLQLLKDESVLDAVVASSAVGYAEYAGQNMTFRIPTGDGVDATDSYGLDSLSQMAANDNGMMNMLDLGGNLGRVTIAAFKKHPQKMRIVAVEPVAPTYFLLRWNLWLNGIPELTMSDFQKSPMKAGVLALNNGIETVDGQITGLCWNPPFSMRAQPCNCSAQKDVKAPGGKAGQCLPMVGRTIDSLLDIFDDEPIAFLKMDCEGCERNVLPTLVKWSQTSGRHIGRFAGELHSVTNEEEDFVCQFEGGQWFDVICHVHGFGYQAVALSERCKQGPGRESCAPRYDIAARNFSGAAYAALPRHLYDLGLQLLQKEAVLDAVVANTRLESVVHAGESMTFRVPIGAATGPADGYGLDSLKDLAGNRAGMVNMLDIGGSLGRVSIAAFKKQPNRMRIIVLEPVPSTYLLLVWNLWLNGIPFLTLSEFQTSPLLAGVVALHNGIAGVDSQVVGFCWTPPDTMSARICDCSLQEEVEVPENGVRQCLPSLGVTIGSILDMFGNETITFLKMDCEGCEFTALPSLVKRSQVLGQQIVRVAGELHEPTNEVEDSACQFEAGRWFNDICFVEGPGFQSLSLGDRCQRGQDRVSCRRK